QRRGPRARRGSPDPAARAPQETETEITVPFDIAAVGGMVSLSVDGKSIDVKVPAGVKEGQSLRLQGQGPGGGNLLLKLHVAPHPYFRRENDDVILDVPISVAEAALGGKVEVPTVDGLR